MLDLLKVGHCFHPEAMVMRGHSWRKMMFPAIVGLIRHPIRGVTLFDTGYAERFDRETATFPERFYRWVTPMHLPAEEDLVVQLQQQGIAADEVRQIFISHFHADHIAGLRDFPRASFYCSRPAYAAIRNLGRFRGVSKGYLAGLLPDDFEARCVFIEDCQSIGIDSRLQPFRQGYDLFGDASLIAIALPGHAIGQFGLLLESNARSRFLIGDAAWTENAYVDDRKPNLLTHLIMDSGREYCETLRKLASLYLANDDLQLIPSHCQYSFQAFQRDSQN
jgi:glyoxylase-like metal-dependent hydrolase (beta-lactamase superfamily II)